MAAKRRLDFNTPRGKRAKAAPTQMVMYRSPKSEMKHLTTNITYSAATVAGFVVNNPVQGPGVNERIGNKIKCWYIEGIIACTASTPIRLDIIMPNDPTALFTVTFDQVLDRRILSVLGTKFLTNGTGFAASGAELRHKLPLGVVTKFGDGTAASLNKNAIYCVLSTPAAQTITGQFRCWYTDF